MDYPYYYYYRYCYDYLTIISPTIISEENKP